MSEILFTLNCWGTQGNKLVTFLLIVPKKTKKRKNMKKKSLIDAPLEASQYKGIYFKQIYKHFKSFLLYLTLFFPNLSPDNAALAVQRYIFVCHSHSTICTSWCTVTRLPHHLLTSSPSHLLTSSPLHLLTSSPPHLFTSLPPYLPTSSPPI